MTLRTLYRYSVKSFLSLARSDMALEPELPNTYPHGTTQAARAGCVDHAAVQINHR
jgi:hypothetical protein